jgi:tRNA dimethylallyltransferase
MIIVIVGPTGIGKTKLSIALAKHFNTEIISGDSVQVYKELNIGSAKVSEEEMDGITHHLIDILEPDEDFSVALFQKLVRNKITDFKTRGITPIIAGGTGLYIKSVLYDYNFENTKRDDKLGDLYSGLSNQELHLVLQEKDIESAYIIHPNNRKRVLQAISRSALNKVSKNKNKDIKLYDFVIIGLTLEREKLYEIINNRVDKMIEEGLLAEVKQLYDKEIRSNCISAIGYKELYKYFDGEYTLIEGIAKIKQHSRNLAKKQFTFFNNQFDITWIDSDLDNFNNTINKAIQIIEDKR